MVQTLQSRPGDRLNRHVDAYVNNMVNCSLLLDDAEAKEAAVEEVSRLEAALEASESTAKQQAASFKVRYSPSLCIPRSITVVWWKIRYDAALLSIMDTRFFGPVPLVGNPVKVPSLVSPCWEKGGSAWFSVSEL